MTATLEALRAERDISSRLALDSVMFTTAKSTPRRFECHTLVHKFQPFAVADSADAAAGLPVCAKYIACFKLSCKLVYMGICRPLLYEDFTKALAGSGKARPRINGSNMARRHG